MKILLLGEYSNFHNTLKKGLTNLGHYVVLIGRKDGFKSYPIDVNLDPKTLSKTPFKYLRSFIYRILKFDIASFEILYSFFKNRNQFKDYDCVQLINQYPIKTTPLLDKFLLKYIFKHNKNVYVSACGDDVVYINHILQSDLPYHILTPYLKDKSLKKHFIYSLDYLSVSHKKLSDYVLKNVIYVIPADMDYYMAYKNHPKAQPLIPFPINTDANSYIPMKIDGKIKIFHGINKVNFYKKGNDYFSKALINIKKKYGDRVEIIEVENMPYSTYINLYNESHILLDQVYSYDQGYNALEAMAKGKVVFTGVSEEFKNHYNITNTIAINAIPDVEAIVSNLSWLIENPEEIIKISRHARAYIEQHHDYSKIAQTYLNTWST